MKKLRKMIESWANGVNRPKGFRVYMLEAMVAIYNELCEKKKVLFLEEDLAPYFEQCGFKVTPPHGTQINFTVERKR